MTAYAALYGVRAVTIDGAWVEANADGGKVEHGAASRIASAQFTLRWGEDSLTLRSALDDSHREKTVERMRAECDGSEGDVATILDTLGRCRTLLFLSFPEAPPEQGRAMAWVRKTQRALEALLIRDVRVEDADAILRLTLAPEDEDEAPPPEPERVSRRARVLAAVVARVHFEQAPATAQLSRLWDWLAAHGLWAEAELAERELIRSERGKANPQALVDGSWRAEGLAVLAWALGLSELTAHDVPSDSQRLTGSLGIFSNEVPAGLSPATLRSSAELETVSKRLLALHWRTRDFALRRAPMDFVEFAKTAWFGPLETGGIALADRDLSISGLPIARADPAAVRVASSIAAERHRAINWLRGSARRYSEVDTST
jgi:hypothetical protein